MKIVIHPEFADAASFIKQLPQFFEQEGELLYDSRNKVKRYKVNGKDMVVKRYKRPNMIQRIVYTFSRKARLKELIFLPGCCGKEVLTPPMK